MKIDFDKLKMGNRASPILEPRKIFTTLTNKDQRYSYLRDVQAEVLESWFEKRDDPDNVMKMNTGAGKTLVGLLVLQSCLAEGMGPAIYAAPDRFLCQQVLAEACMLGIQTTTDTSSIQFRNGSAILVVPIHKIVNGKSVFGVGKGGVRIEIGSLLVDDAHACLATAESQFSLSIPIEHQGYSDLLELFEDDLRNQSEPELLNLEAKDPSCLMLVPYWAWHKKQSEAVELVHRYRDDDEIKFVWPLIAENFGLCDCLFSSRRVEISSGCLPIDQIPSFTAAKRRIYMTATLADDSILVTDFNVARDAANNPITPGSASDIGERLILAPQALNPEVSDEELRAYCRRKAETYNVVVITPSAQRAEDWKDFAAEIVNKENIHTCVERLRSGHVGLVVMINKYDGIDLPDNACRILVVDGLPEVRRLVDRYDQSVLNDGDEILSRQMQRIEQGMGRGVRANADYCVVIVMGSKLVQALYSQNATNHMSPATAVQMRLSQQLSEQLMGAGLEDIDSVTEMCLGRDDEWVTASRGTLVDVTYESGSRISDFATGLRQAFSDAQIGQYKSASSTIEELANLERDSKLKGWLMQRLAATVDQFDRSRAQEIQLSASRTNRCLLKPLEGICYSKLSSERVCQADRALQFMREKGDDPNGLVLWIHGLIEDLEFYECDATRFEKAMLLLGKLLGFGSQRPEAEFGKGPDNLWRLGSLNFLVIECKNGAVSERVSKRDVNQLAGSVNWFRTEYDQTCKCTAVIVHKSRVLSNEASPEPGMRLVDAECLSLLRKELACLARELGNAQGEPSSQKLVNILNNYGFTESSFITKFSREPKLQQH